LSLTKFGGGAALVALPFITASIWVLLHFHWVTVSNSGPISGTRADSVELRCKAYDSKLTTSFVVTAGLSTLKPLSYDEFRKAYTQPSMIAVEQEDANYAKAGASTTGTCWHRLTLLFLTSLTPHPHAASKIRATTATT
jgi:hypothetical protein